MRIFDCLNDVNNMVSTINYVKKYGGLEKIDDLINHKIIVLKIDGNINNDYIKMEHFLIEKALQNGIELENIVEIDSMIAIAKAVENDMGLAVLPCFLENDKLIQILEEIEVPDMPCYFVHHKKYVHQIRLKSCAAQLFFISDRITSSRVLHANHFDPASRDSTT
jgi:hypothetical protein